MQRALIFDPDPRSRLAQLLAGESFAVDAAADPRAALESARRGGHRLVVVDIGRADIARAARAGSPSAFVVTCGPEHVDPAAVRAALAAGADDHLALPTGPAVVAALAHRALAAEARRAEAAAAPLRAALEALLPRGPSCASTRRALDRAVATRGPAVVIGEPGSGRTLAARAALACALGRADARSVDCGRPGEEVAAALLGVGGALLPGACSGLVLEAPDLLPERIARAALDAVLAGSGPRVVGVMTPEAVTGAGRQRRTGAPATLLAWLLRGERVRLTPLRERLDDLRALVGHYAAAVGPGAPRPSPAFLAALARAPWPGNLRELEGAVGAAVALANGAPSLEVAHLPADAPGDPEALTSLLASAERAALRESLEWSRGAVAVAAADLGVPERTLRRKMRAADVRKESFRRRRG